MGSFDTIKTINKVNRELGLSKKYLINVLIRNGRKMPHGDNISDDDYFFLINTLKEESVALKARKIAERYRDSFMFYFRSYNYYITDYQKAIKVIEKESLLEESEELFKRFNSAFSEWERICRIPYFYFFNYYPKRRYKTNNLSMISLKARNLIYQFMDGSYDSFAPLFIEKLQATFAKEDIKKMCLVCNPASTNYNNRKRFKDFSNRVSFELGIEDSYEHVVVEKDEIPLYLGGSGEEAQFKIDKDFFHNKYIILFDILITKFSSLVKVINMLEECGAVIICMMSVGRTVPYGSESQSLIHPWTKTN